MAAKKNNKYAEKFETPAKRKKLCKQWCEHLSEGFTRESFPYCDPDTFKRYIKKYPKDFDKHLIEEAKANQQLKWEKRLAKHADGGKGSATSIRFGLEMVSGFKTKVEHSYDKDAPPPPPPAPVINNHIDLSQIPTEDLRTLRDIAKRVSKSTPDDS
ncbi:hypothetical protein KA005_06175 [bacterium]|nr:hypothetical protein [bacterium]